MNGTVVYINWDGFAWYYYELANKNGQNNTPVLNSLIGKGVLFKNTYSGIPAITNPMQTAIVSGAWPEVTGNCYGYYDKKGREVIRQKRENRAETIAEAIVRQGLRPASIHQFALENRGTFAGDPDKPYITMGNNANYKVRFDAAIKLIKRQAAGRGSSWVRLDYLPDFIAIYMDDLDGIGHNMGITYGVLPVSTEEKRIKKIVKRLRKMDEKLGEFIEACKKAGVYEGMSFILTSDHGMAPFGQQGKEADGYGRSKLPELINDIRSVGYKAEVLSPDKSPANDTDIVLVTAGLEVQLFFTADHTKADMEKITGAVKDKEYAGTIIDREQMCERGAAEAFADLLISPKVPCCFKTDFRLHKAKGQHDSLDEHTQHIFSMMWGKGIKQGYVYNDRIYIIDFARTMTELLNIEGPKDATGRILKDALTDN